MRDISDMMLISALAKNLHQMRESRIIIWLDCNSSTSSNLMGLIIEAAQQHNFRNLLVFDNVKDRIIPYRLQPFPSPSVQRIENITNERPIFPKMYSNFHGKTAVILPDLITTRSFRRNNSKTGKEELCGSSVKMVIEFTKRHNITLQYHPSYQRHQIIDPLETLMRTVRGEIDLPIRVFAQRITRIMGNIEYLPGFELDDLLIIVPCGEEMGFGDVLLYTGLKTYSLIVVGAYFMFATLETFAVASSYRMHRGRFNFSYFSLFFNLRAFCGVLGLPMRLNRHSNSNSLRQIVVVMSLLGIILSCLFNVNLSTLLTKSPENKHIENFEELRSSGLDVSCEITTKEFIENEIDDNYFKTEIINFQKFSNAHRQHLIFSFNTSYAYILYSYTWRHVDAYQKRFNLNKFCSSKALKIINGIPMSGVMIKNSIFKKPLQEFMQLSYDMGLYKYWSREAMRQLFAKTYAKKLPRNPQELRPLSVVDFQWLWALMAVSYALAMLVFLLEICAASWQSKRNKKSILCI